MTRERVLEHRITNKLFFGPSHEFTIRWWIETEKKFGGIDYDTAVLHTNQAICAVSKPNLETFSTHMMVKKLLELVPAANSVEVTTADGCGAAIHRDGLRLEAARPLSLPPRKAFGRKPSAHLLVRLGVERTRTMTLDQAADTAALLDDAMETPAPPVGTDLLGVLVQLDWGRFHMSFKGGLRRSIRIPVHMSEPDAIMVGVALAQRYGGNSDDVKITRNGEHSKP